MADSGSRRIQVQCSTIRAKAISTLIERQPFPLLPSSRGSAEAAPTRALSPRPVARRQECKRPKASRSAAPESRRLASLLARVRWQLPGLSLDLGTCVLVLPRHGVPPAQRPILRPLSLPDLFGLRRGDLVDGRPPRVSGLSGGWRRNNSQATHHSDIRAPAPPLQRDLPPAFVGKPVAAASTEVGRQA